MLFMLCDTLQAFAETLPKNTRLLGLDVGEKRIGLAVSDANRSIGSPHSTLTRQGKKKDIPALRRLMEEYNVGGIVVGLPKNMDGSEGASCEEVRRFVGHLAKAVVATPIYLQDERLSTAAVNRAMKEAEMNRKKRASLDDQLAASYILQGVLDALKYL